MNIVDYNNEDEILILITYSLAQSALPVSKLDQLQLHRFFRPLSFA